jgi:predicted 3-demethylubiquinone-9 3-methyltransferase (glyoxalase superfamily)
MQKITPFLWFDNQAEEAANFYVSVFKNSKIKGMTRYTDRGQRSRLQIKLIIARNFHCSECWQFHFPSSNIGCSALASDL